MNPRTYVRTIVVLAFASPLLAACSGGSDGTVSGTIILPDGASVPDDATINVQVQDTSMADAVVS